MDLQQIGMYIARKRKAQGLTQEELAKQLNVTNKAVSKWENGKCLPDSSHYEALCDALHITLNELLAGRDIEVMELAETSENNMKEVLKSNEHLKSLKDVCIAVLLLLIGRMLPLTQLKDATSEATQFIFGVSEGLSIGITCLGVAWLIYGVVKYSRQN